MNLRCVSSLLLLPVLALGGCSSTTITSAPTTRAQHGIDCASCFTIIEFMRSGPRHQSHERVQMRCELCCNTLTFTTDDIGQMWVSSTNEPEPRPCDVCAPGR
jgi:hypothetical protein